MQPTARLFRLALPIVAAVVATAIGIGAASTSPASLALAAPSVVPGTQLPPLPRVHAKAWIVYDGTANEVLGGQGIADRRAIASLTKLMTALLVVQSTKGDELVPISAAAASTNSGSAIGMVAGQKYPVDTLLDAMLVHSANDAAVALAEFVGGTQGFFVGKMNARAAQIGLTHTRFTTVHGLDHKPLTLSTPEDVVALAQIALREPRIARAEHMTSVTVQRPGAQTITFPNRNTLVGSYPGVDSGKTGHTLAAGYCLLVHYSDVSGGDLWVADFGEPDEATRDADVRALLDWSRQLRPKVVFGAPGQLLGTVPVADSDQRLQLFLSGPVVAHVRIGKPLRERIRIPARITAPVHDGDEVGTYQILVDHTVVASSPVYVHPGAAKPTSHQRWNRRLQAVRDDFSSGLREVRSQATHLAEYWGLA